MEKECSFEAIYFGAHEALLEDSFKAKAAKVSEEYMR